MSTCLSVPSYHIGWAYYVSTLMEKYKSTICLQVYIFIEIIPCEPLQRSSFPYRPWQNHLSPICHRVTISNTSMPSR
jgi:hypothetical protein